MIATLAKSATGSHELVFRKSRI